MTTFTDSSASDGHPGLSDSELDSMLRGHRPAGVAPEAVRAADVMNALTAPPDPGELVGYSQAMATYRRAFVRPRSGRAAMISSAAGLKALASTAGAAVALGGVATFVFASGAMGPTHQTAITPAATTSATKAVAPKPDKTGTPVGPDASGPAAFGLCNAWSHHSGRDKPESSVAFRNLAEAAGGESKIAAYCAKVPHPGSSNASKKPKDATKPSGTAKPGKAPATPPGKDKPKSTATADTPRPSATATLTPLTPATTLPSVAH